MSSETAFYIALAILILWLFVTFFIPWISNVIDSAITIQEARAANVPKQRLIIIYMESAFQSFMVALVIGFLLTGFIAILGSPHGDDYGTYESRAVAETMLRCGMYAGGVTFIFAFLYLCPNALLHYLRQLKEDYPF